MRQLDLNIVSLIPTVDEYRNFNEKYNKLKVEYNIIEKKLKNGSKVNRIIFSKPGIERQLNPG